MSEETAGTQPASPTAAIRGCSSLDEAVDVLVENDRCIAALMARRAAIIDEARQLSESTARSPSGSATGWNARLIARRELVASVACALRLPERTAENLIETSRTLVHNLPATHGALSVGSINYRQAETIVDHSYSLPAEGVGEFEAVVLKIAPTLTNAQLDRRASRLRERLHPESITTRHKAAIQKRCVDLAPAHDGMAWLSAHLSAATAIAAYNRITELALNVGREGKDTGMGEETSTLSQLRADVLADLLVDGVTYDLPSAHTVTPAHTTELAHAIEDAPTTKFAPARTNTVVFAVRAVEALSDRAPEAESAIAPSAGGQSATTGIGGRPVRSIRRGIGRGVRATVHVTVPVLTLLGSSEAPAELEGYGPIDPETARQLAASAPSFQRILTHPESGVVLSVGRGSYAVPKDLRRWLVLRDETCRFPGCSRSARRSEIDHTVDWQFGSDTAHRNLAHLCLAHHHFKHQTAWSYTQDGHGRLEWTSTTGHRYATEPAVQLHGETGVSTASTDRWIFHPDDPPDADDDDPRYFVIRREAS